MDTKVMRLAITIAARSLKRRRFRSALTLIGVAVGMSTVVALTAVALGAREAAVGVLTQTTDFMVMPRGGSEFQAELPESLVKHIRLYPEVEMAGPVLSQMLYLEKEPAWAMGVTDESADITRLSLVEGRRVEERGEIVVGYTLAQDLGVKVGDVLRLSVSPDEPGTPMKVVGILEPTGGVTDMAVYLSLSELQEMVGKKGKISMIMIRLKDPRLADQFKARVEERYPDLEVYDTKQIAENVGRVLDMMNSLILAIGGISLLVGGLGVMNTTMVSVLERTREIGVMKAIGAKRSHILTIFLMESFILGMMGGVIGVLGGAALAKLASTLIPKMVGFPLPAKLTWWLIVSPILFAGLLGVVAGFYPSWRGASVRPMEAIRYE